MTSFNFKALQILLGNSVVIRVRASTYEFEKGQIQTKQ